VAGSGRHIAFDLLWQEGVSLIGLPWRTQRSRLESLELRGKGWQTVEVFTDGPALFEGTLDTGFEGVVSKRTFGRYHPGLRTTDWRKTKHMRTARFVIGGWAEDREGRPEALLVGTRGPDGRLRSCGPVRFGFSARRLIEDADPLRVEDSPFSEGPTGSGVVFLWPEIEVEVSYQTVTSDGLIRNAAIRWR
jgi:bifunctional non-homologous end joining protein LigD